MSFLLGQRFSILVGFCCYRPESILHTHVSFIYFLCLSACLHVCGCAVSVSRLSSSAAYVHSSLLRRGRHCRVNPEFYKQAQGEDNGLVKVTQLLKQCQQDLSPGPPYPVLACVQSPLCFALRPSANVYSVSAFAWSGTTYHLLPLCCASAKYHHLGLPCHLPPVSFLSVRTGSASTRYS